MEKRMSASVSPDQEVVISTKPETGASVGADAESHLSELPKSFASPFFITATAGFALFWACFFTMLMRNSFMDASVEQLWYHLFLRIAFLLGAGIVCFAASMASDHFARERGHRILKGGTCLFSVIAGVSALSAFTLGISMPLLFDLFAWGLAGAGLACLLVLWIEMLASVEASLSTGILAASIGTGGVGYLLLNLLPFPFSTAFLCLSPLASLGIMAISEYDGSCTPPAFVPRADSLKRARLTIPYLAISTAYGVVFGLGIGSTTQFPGQAGIFTSIAAFLLIGAGAAFLFLSMGKTPDLQSRSLRLLFPFLIVALIPMSFLQGVAYTACNFLLLSCYVFFEIVSIRTSISIAAERRASYIQLVGTSQAFLYLGLLLGHAIGLVATSTGVMNYSMLSAVALGLVVALAILITFAPVAALHDRADDDAPKHEEAEAHEPGRWKQKCHAVAQAAGLSARETEVFMLLAKGRGVEHIQNKLFISGHTVKTHIYNIYKKMGINSREELLDAIEAAHANGEADGE